MIGLVPVCLKSLLRCWLGPGRLSAVVGRRICICQSSVVEGCQILDTFLIANKTVEERRRNGEGLVFEVDFEPH